MRKEQMGNNATVYTRDDGLRIVCVNKPGYLSTHLSIESRRGARYEEDGEHGIVHLGEHCIFGGTATRSKEEIYDEIERLGDTTNACTSYDYVRVHGTFANDDLSSAASLMADMFVNPSMPEWYVEQEKEIVRQEISQCNDDPIDRLFDEAYRKLIKGGIGHTVLGEKDGVASYKRSDVIAAWQRGINGNDVIFGMTGSLAEEHVEKVASAVPLLPPSDGRAEPGFTVLEGVECFIDAPENEHVYLSMMYPGPPSEDRRAVLLFDYAISAIGQGQNSRFFLKLREEMMAAYTVGAGQSANRGGSVTYTFGAVNRDKWELVVERMLEEIDDVVKNGLTEAEISRIKECASRSYAINADYRPRILADAVACCMAGIDMPDYEQERRDIMAMTAAEIQEEAGRWLSRKPSMVVMR